MKIALLTLTRGTVSGGYAKYLRELVPRLRASAEVEELRVFVPPPMAGHDPAFRPWTDLRSLRAEVLAGKPDVVFIPSSVHLDFGAIPVVTMVRNMEPLEVPFEGNGPADAARNLARAWLARRAARRSARVIAVSGHVRDFVVQRWRLDPARVGVVPHGVDTADVFVRPAELPEGEPFLFTAGSLRPARGLDDLAAAAPSLPAALRIVIAGAPDAGTRRYAASLRRRLPGALWLGRLTPAEMAWCFANARLFVMTSRAEACPNTVLEALAHGSLSLSTDHPPMPEFFGDAALYYRERDPADLARAVARALAADPAPLRAAAVERSRRFTWDATLDGTLRELRAAVSAVPPPATARS